MLKKLATVKNLKTLFILSFVFQIIIFPLLSHLMNVQEPILDLRFSYDEDDVKQLFKALEKQNSLDFYRYTIILVDIIYPIIYTLLLTAIIRFLMLKNNVRGIWKYLALLPLFIIFFDYLENYNTLNMINSFKNNPNFHDHQAFFGSSFTSWKWISVIINFLLIIIFFIISKTKKSSQTI